MERKKQILEAADRLFAHYGVKKTTIGDIAEEAGIGTGSVYLEFPSKQSIVCGLAQSRLDGLLVELETILNDDKRDVADRVIRYFERRAALLYSACSRGAHAHEVLACTGAEDSPRKAFEATQVAMLARVVDDTDVAKGLLLAFRATLDPRGHIDPQALVGLKTLVKRALTT